MCDLFESIKQSLRRIYETPDASKVLKNIIKEYDSIKNNINELVDVELLDKQHSNILNAQMDEMLKSIFDEYAKSKYISEIINCPSKYISNDEFIDYYFIYKFHERIINIYNSNEKVFKDLLDLYDAHNDGLKYFGNTHIIKYFITFEKIRNACECVKSDFEQLGIKLIKLNNPLVDIDRIGDDELFTARLSANVNNFINHDVKMLINSFDIKENKFITNNLEISDIAQSLIDLLNGEDGPMSLLNLRIENEKNKINELLDELKSFIDANDENNIYSEFYDKLRKIDRLTNQLYCLRGLYKRITIEYNKYKAEGTN